MWFANKSDEGIKYSAYFNPFPVSAIALILTVVRILPDLFSLGLMGWDFGRSSAASMNGLPVFVFRSNSPRQNIDPCMTIIFGSNAFGEATKKYDLLEKIQVKTHNRGRFHAGVQPIYQTTQAPAIGPAAFAAALKEYEGGREDRH
ncbi:hypothetical protein MVEN_00019400 [Mycena venus]|uniref:DUF6532 domain-containing protein n=1 Tax=Mycena venus TaxID=2733690 RepID=A0A8H6Z628_9AGAR|nr:hypothetical protein MVEN_00019400 [Mycena venus]